MTDCGNIAPPANGAVDFPSGTTTYGEIADYTCEPGYDLVGVASRTCQSDSHWSGTEPTCDIKGKFLQYISQIIIHKNLFYLIKRMSINHLNGQTARERVKIAN